MTSRRLLPTLTAALLLGAAASAQAATPFNVGSNGSDPDIAVADGGTGHIVWTTPSPSTVGYCRVPAGGGACDRTTTLTFPGASAANQRDASVFAPTANKVVIVAGCWNCGVGGGVTERVFQWTSTDRGVSFLGPFEIQGAAGFSYADGSGAWLDDANLFVGIAGSKLQAMPPGVSGAVTHTGFALNYGPEVARVWGANTLVSAVNDITAITYNVYSGPSLAATAINNPANWGGPQPLAAPEPGNNSSGLSAGPSGLFLHYRRDLGGDSQVGLRRFDPATKTFGAPQYIAGDNGIDHVSLAYPDTFVDGSGRVHATWRTLYDGGRLRYTVSDTTGTTFSAPATVAAHEAILAPRVAAGPDGQGFAAWRSTGGLIRAVALEPVPEVPGGGGGGGGGGGTPSGPGTTPTTPGGPGTPTTPTRRPSPQRTTTARVPGATVSFGVPRGCVVRGKTFTVTLSWKKQKRKGNKFVKVRRADFYIGTKRVKIDRKAPFRQRLRVTAKARKGSKITVRARAFIKVTRGKSPTKSIRATIQVCK